MRKTVGRDMWKNKDTSFPSSSSQSEQFTCLLRLRSLTFGKKLNSEVPFHSKQKFNHCAQCNKTPIKIPSQTHTGMPEVPGCEVGSLLAVLPFGDPGWSE